MLLNILIAVLSTLAIYIFFSTRDYYGHDLFKDFSKNSVPLMKNSFAIVRMSPVELFQFARDCAKAYKKSHQVKFFGRHVYSVIRAKDAERVLGSSKLITKSIVYSLLHPFLKTGLLTSEGEKWFQRRKLLTPAFHFNILKEYVEIFKEESDKLVESLKLKTGKIIDILPISTQFTLNAVCESAMGVKLSNLGSDGVTYRNNIYKIGSLLLYRFIRPWLIVGWINALFGNKKEFDEALVPVHEFTKSIINERRHTFFKDKTNFNTATADKNENIYMSKKKRYAMLDTLLLAQSEGLIDDEGIIEETDTFTFEGHDTTSAGMTFTLLLLAHHLEVQEKLFDEIQAVMNQSRSEDGLGIDDFNKMNYMERVIKESLRIYPPVPYIARKVTEDFIHDGITYAAGAGIQVMIFDIHRDPEYFPDPEKFDPDRFLPDQCEKRHNFAFVAFSAGMRNCIGQKFAILELKVMLTKVIQNFTIHPITKRSDLVFKADMILRTIDPVKMKFEIRK